MSATDGSISGTSDISSLNLVEVSRSALRRNLRAIRSRLHPDTKIACVVKGNAYGHGLEPVVEALHDQADLFQVDDACELERLREVEQLLGLMRKRVLVLGYVAPWEVERTVELDGEPAVFDTERLATLNSAAIRVGRMAAVHLEVDAFLGRQGLLPGDVRNFTSELNRHPSVSLAGVYAHFANIEDTSDFSHAVKQIQVLDEAVFSLKGAGAPPFETHISSTAGSLLYEQSKGLNPIVRVGIGLYGLYPSTEIQAQFGDLGLTPALRWVSHVAQVKELPADFPIGYGLTHVTERPTKVAIVPQGYSDGYSRAFSNRGCVLIHGQRCPVLGRVSMNMITVDVSGVDGVGPDDEVVLLGTQRRGALTAEELANQIGTINYEIVTAISPLLPRVLVP